MLQRIDKPTCMEVCSDYTYCVESNVYVQLVKAYMNDRECLHCSDGYTNTYVLMIFTDKKREFAQVAVPDLLINDSAKQWKINNAGRIFNYGLQRSESITAT